MVGQQTVAILNVVVRNAEFLNVARIISRRYEVSRY